MMLFGGRGYVASITLKPLPGRKDRWLSTSSTATNKCNNETVAKDCIFYFTVLAKSILFAMSSHAS